MKNKNKKIDSPDLTEFTDDDGKKWIQTSTEDLFSSDELNDILTSIKKDESKGEIVLAQLNFKKVNKEYYEAVKELESKLKKQTELLKKIILDSSEKIEKKNHKLKELIEYIKKLHTYIAYIHSNSDEIDSMNSPGIFIQSEKLSPIEPENNEKVESIFEEVKETVLAAGTSEQDMLKQI